MDIIDLPLEGRQDPDGLKLFLSACREAADTDNHYKVASITLGVRHIDPLAVLDSIYEEKARHFYMENRSRGWAVAGAETVVSGNWNGANRFRQAKAFIQEVQDHTICIGEMSLPFSGPMFFTGFTFFGVGPGCGEDFPAGQVFVPQWQVARSQGQYVAVANVLIEPWMDVEPAARRIWNAHEKFIRFSYDGPEDAPVYRLIRETEVGAEGTFVDNVSRAIGEIRNGSYEKIVLARAMDLHFDNDCQPLRILNRLRQDYPECSTFSLQNEQGDSFIGATPERLISVADGAFQTEALAGSAARSGSATEDARLARSLLSSEKDLHEHQIVVSSISRRLEPLTREVETASVPQLLVLPNVQHLCTPIRGQLAKGVHLLDLAEVLHPTPALGGTPREAALVDIARWEPFSRGLFGGLVGWLDCHGRGELDVGIRSAMVSGPKARLYAGAGIVEGSDPELEFKETSMKMEALLRCIRGQSESSGH